MLFELCEPVECFVHVERCEEVFVAEWEEIPVVVADASAVEDLFFACFVCEAGSSAVANPGDEDAAVLFYLEFIDGECDCFADALDVLLEEGEVACPVEVFDAGVGVVNAGDGVS